MGSPGPAQLLDSGLCGLSLVAGYYRIAGDPTQLRHQLALTGRKAQVEDVVRGAKCGVGRSCDGECDAAALSPAARSIGPRLFEEAQADREGR
jgi:hypothetical protein